MAATAVGISKTIALSDLGGIVLSEGNNDRKQQWGGKSWGALKGTPVLDLQSVLVSVGLLEKADGEFGHKTKIALERYQWYRQNIGYALSLTPGAAPMTGRIVTCMPFTGSTPPGVCDRGLACDLLAWKNANLMVTTPIVRVSIKNLSNVQLASSFEVLDYPFAGPSEILLHADFASAVQTVNDEAVKAKVTVLLTQAFRREGASVRGAVVQPADNSPHYVGHALDWNVQDGKTLNGSVAFKAGQETEAADSFVQGVKAGGYRWGGDFRKKDPVHFDDNPYLNVNHYQMTRFFAQHSFRASHPMRLVS